MIDYIWKGDVMGQIIPLCIVYLYAGRLRCAK